MKFIIIDPKIIDTLNEGKSHKISPLVFDGVSLVKYSLIEEKVFEYAHEYLSKCGTMVLSMDDLKKATL